VALTLQPPRRSPYTGDRFIVHYVHRIRRVVMNIVCVFPAASIGSGVLGSIDYNHDLVTGQVTEFVEF